MIVSYLFYGWAAVRRHGMIFLAVSVIVAGNTTSAQPQSTALTLDSAIHQSLAHNPGLQVFDLRKHGLLGQRQTAGLAPAYALGTEVENVAGSGNAQGFDSAELTLSLSSVIEMGGKREARMALIDARGGLLEAERKAEALDVLGQVTQRFIAALASQERLALSAQKIQLAETALQVVKQRTRAGAAPDAEVLRAKAALSQTRIEQSRIETRFATQKVALAAIWGDTSTSFDRLRGNLFQFSPADSFEALYQRVADNPLLQVYAREQRVKAAELELARSRSSSDIQWNLGVRRSEESGNAGIVAGFSLPLFSVQRNQGDIQTAMAARDEIRFQRESALLSLHTQLFDAYRQRQQSIEAVEAWKNDIIPALTRALDETRRAYERGRYSYVDWMAAQRELLAAQQALIDSAESAQVYGAMIEQLTAEPLSANGQAQ